MIYKRFVKFLANIATNRRTALVSLLNSVTSTCRSLTGGNIRRILLDSGTQIIPGKTKGTALVDYRVSVTPTGEEWRVGLLKSLLEIKDDRWHLEFDEEAEQFEGNEINEMITNVCIS